MVARTRQIVAALTLGVAILGAAGLSTGCARESPSAQCQAAINRYWGSLDIEPYFSAVTVRDAVNSCVAAADKSFLPCVMSSPLANISDCPGISQLEVDRGWRGGITCYRAEDDGWSRCERSNRECEYYRRVARRSGRKISRCEPTDQAWAIRFGSDHVNPAPTEASCFEIRDNLISRGLLDSDARCEKVDYARLRSGRRKSIATPVVE